MYNRTELQEIAKKQEYVYVVVFDRLEIVKYKTSEINFDYTRACFDINTNDIIEVYAKRKDAFKRLYNLIKDTIDTYKEKIR